MRILVVGAGATGGYFGGRLLQAGQDVTFLVRPKRAAELASTGLVIKSPHGDMTLGNPPTVQAAGLRQTFDLVLLSCKAFDLEDAITSFAPAAGPRTAILPLLNGMRHLETLDATFHRERVLGGLCSLAVTLNEKREVVHLAPMQSLRFGERNGGTSERVRAIAEAFAGASCGAQASETIIQDMWEKCRTCGKNGCFWRRSPARPAGCAHPSARSSLRLADTISSLPCWMKSPVLRKRQVTRRAKSS